MAQRVMSPSAPNVPGMSMISRLTSEIRGMRKIHESRSPGTTALETMPPTVRSKLRHARGLLRIEIDHHALAPVIRRHRQLGAQSALPTGSILSG